MQTGTQRSASEMLVAHEFTMLSELFVVFPEVVEYLYIRSSVWVLTQVPKV